MARAGKKFKPDRGYTREDWDAVDSPPLTPEQLAQAKPFAEMFPELAETMRRNVGDRLVSEKPKRARWHARNAAFARARIGRFRHLAGINSFRRA